MTPFRHRAVAVVAVALAAGLAVPASAAAIQCTVLPPIGVGGPFGTQIPQYAVLKNTLGRTIVADTVYTLVVNGRTFTHQEPRPLNADETLSLQVAYGTPQGACVASVPGFKFPVLNGTFSTAPLAVAP